MMRLDADLCYLSRCGPPSAAELEEIKQYRMLDQDEDEDSMSSKTPNESRASSVKPEDADGGKEKEKDSKDAKEVPSEDLQPFPSAVEVNGRLRRLIAGYQRDFRRDEARRAVREREERRERMEQAIREREQKALQRKWSSREESDFQRTLAAFGVEYSRKERRYVWDRFRQLARLEKKFDDTLTEHFMAFVAMCKRKTGRKISAEEELMQTTVEPVSEEKARKVLERVELLNHLREDIVVKADLDEKMKVCDTAQDLPSWWIPGKHDRDLLLGAAKHGMSRMDYYVLNDPDLCFKDILTRHLRGEDLVDKKDMDAFLKRIQKTRPSPKKEEPPSEEKEDEVKEEKKPTTEDNEKTKENDEEVKEEKKEKEESSADEKAKEEEASEKRETRGRKGKGSKKKKEKEVVEEEKLEEVVTETRARRKSTKDATEATKLAIGQAKMARAEAAKTKEKKTKDDDKEKDEDKKEAVKAKGKGKEDVKKEEEVQENSEPKTEKKPEDKQKKSEPEPSTPAPPPTPKRKVAVSIPPPQISIQQMEQMAKGGMIYDMEVMNDLMAQTYASAIKWPKDKILEVRLGHIVKCVETGIWPVPHDYPLGNHLATEKEEAAAPEENKSSASATQHRDGASTPMSESSDVSMEDPNVLTHGSRGGRRRGRRPLDAVPEEKSKIRSLLQQPALSAAQEQHKSENARYELRFECNAKHLLFNLFLFTCGEADRS